MGPMYQHGMTPDRPQPLSEEELRGVVQRTAAATPPSEGYFCVESNPTAEQVEDVKRRITQSWEILYNGYVYPEILVAGGVAKAKFIAEAFDDIPRLLATLRAERERAASYWIQMQEMVGDKTRLLADLQFANQRIAELEAKLKAP